MMTKNTDATAGLIVGAALPLIIVVATGLALLVRAFVLEKLWNWYVVPYFHIAHLSLVFAFGFVVIATFLTRKVSDQKNEKPLLFWLSVFLATLLPLLIGWIGTFFI